MPIHTSNTIRCIRTQRKPNRIEKKSCYNRERERKKVVTTKEGALPMAEIERVKKRVRALALTVRRDGSEESYRSQEPTCGLHSCQLQPRHTRLGNVSAPTS